ncbi:MAG: DUF362 domain-containing protein [Candidatus Latescibacteria bacterium]|nr:DUF362 domain-containing protein [Candidatus Latescibacterota bacterium]
MGVSACRVRAAYCDHRASDDGVYDALVRATSPLHRSWDRIERARQVVIKANRMWSPDSIRYFRGRSQELVDYSVLRAVLRLLRERTSARLIVADTSLASAGSRPGPDLNFQPLLDEFGGEYVESNDPPFGMYEVSDPGRMFARYQLSDCLAQADAVVSVAKMKNHAAMGVTLCLKNLFGLTPMQPLGRSRQYFHHIIRLPYVLTDLGRITQPCLNVIDGLVGQSGRELDGDGRVGDVLVAGDHVVATDACGAWLMGHDPSSDWPTPPFKRDRNALLVAAERGFGTVDMSQIDFETEVDRPVASFASSTSDAYEQVRNWRRTMCEQALFYREHHRKLAAQYAGEYIYLQDGRVVWHGEDTRNLGSRWGLSGENKDSALFLKWVDPEEAEGENFELYERILSDM